MNNSGSIDRRRHFRLEAQVPLKLSSDDVDVVTETKNISISGAYCRINKYLEPMTKLKIHLLLPFRKINKTVTKKISCQGVIVRTESIPGNEFFNIAIFFNEIQPKDIHTLGDYIASRVEDPAVGV